MRNSYLGYNPVFESLSQQARKYTGVHINEDALAYEGEKSQRYLEIIIGRITAASVLITTSIPKKDLRDSLLLILSEGYKKIETGTFANIDALIDSLRGIFDRAYAEIAASSSKAELVPIYDKAKEGIELLMKAYENLKKKYPAEMSQPASLTNSKTYLKSSIDSFNATLEELKKKA